MPGGPPSTPHREIKTRTEALTFQMWLREEQKAWMEVMSVDPLLPESLLPQGYLGQAVWNERVHTMAAAADQMRAIQLTGLQV
jgi:DNA-binding transcriptional regulator PaaX